MVFGGLFSFDANKETPQSAAQRRALAEAIMGRTMSPRNVGEGFGAIAEGIVANVERGRAGEAEAAGMAGANDTYGNLISMITGQGGAGSGGTALGAANGVGQSAPTTSSFSGTQQEFIDMLMPTALEVSAETGIDPRIIIAQAAQETGWGRSAPGNNFFGIKSHGQGGGQTLNTHEYINGERVNVSDSFRTFNSPEDSVRGYGQFIRANPRYGEFMAAQGLDAQLDALQASGYATDPSYSQSVGSIARGISIPQRPAQVASLDPSIGMPAPAAPASPAQPMPQVAQAPIQQPAQSGGMDLGYLMEAAQNPWLNEGQRGMINALISQEMQRMDPRYQQQMALGNQQLERGAMELDAMRNPSAPLPEYEIVDGEVVWLDPSQQTAVSGGQFGQPDMTTAMQNYEYLIANGLSPEQAIERAFSGGVTVNTGDQGPRVGTIPPSMALVEDPDPTNPTGFRMEAIPGSPAALEAEQAAAQAQMRGAQTGRYADVVLDDIDRALGLTGGDTTGIMGTLLQNIPGTNSRNLDALLQTIRSNIGFDRLQAMREASPTGGALGAVSDFENRQLQSTLGNLEQSQTEEQLRRNLERVRETYLDIIHGPGNRPGESSSNEQASPFPEGTRIQNDETGEILVLRNGQWVAE